MAKRTPCKWKRIGEIGNSICSVCKGYLNINGKNHCPYDMHGVPRDQFQHLITGEERLFTIQASSKSKELR